MAIASFMTSNPMMVDMDDELSKVKKIFVQHHIHHLLVTDQKKLVGVLTDRDLYKHLSPNVGTAKETHNDIVLLHKRAHQIMARDPIVASQDLTINEAVLMFHDHHISCLPIVDDAMIPIGILTWRDIIAILAKQYRRKLKVAK
jgi:acetoin utilization protein AcuB